MILDILKDREIISSNHFIKSFEKAGLQLLLYKLCFSGIRLHLRRVKEVILIRFQQCFHHKLQSLVGKLSSCFFQRRCGRSARAAQLTVGNSHLLIFAALSSAGGHAAVDTYASAKCCHTGSGPPNRYKITSRSYQRPAPQQ